MQTYCSTQPCHARRHSAACRTGSVDFVAYRQRFPSRWNDNDVYGHLNNTIYYAAMDTTINTWMIQRGGMDLAAGAVIGVCASSSCEYERSATFPDELEVELGTGRVGTTSVTWELRIRVTGEADPIATGRFVHVFVDRTTRRPVAIPVQLRAAIGRDL